MADEPGYTPAVMTLVHVARLRVSYSGRLRVCRLGTCFAFCCGRKKGMHMFRTTASALALSFLIPFAACKRDRPPLTPDPPDWLEGAVDEQAQRAAPGSVRVGDLYTGLAFDEGDRQQWHVRLSGRGCIHLSAAGDQSVEEIALYLWGPTGKRLETERGSTPRTMLRYCPVYGANGDYKFEAKVTEGHGHFAVGLYAEGDPAAAGDPAAEGDPAAAGDAAAKSGSIDKPSAKPDAGAASLDSRVAKLAGTSASGAEMLGEPFNGTADSTDWYVALEKGKCYWFVGAGDDDIDKLSLYLWDPEDKRVKASKAETNEVTVGHCPKSAGMFHFRAQTAGGGGAYQVGIYAKKK